MKLTNWSGNLTYNARAIHYPDNIDELADIVRASNSVRALGSRHSFNAIADSDEDIISFQKLNKIVSLERAKKTLTVEAGVKYGDICAFLHENGFALHNLASLPHISVAGSIATATHGSGITNGNLATGVSAIEFVDAKGDLRKMSEEDGESFYGAVVALGALGAVTKVSLHLQPTFSVQQVVYRNLPVEQLRDNFIAIMSSGYSVSLFSDWKRNYFTEVWIKCKVVHDHHLHTFDKTFFDAELADEDLHPIEDQPAENCTEQLGIPGPWYDRLPHFKMGFTPSAGKELQSEYFIPIEHAYEAIREFQKLRDKIAPYIFVSEIRTVEADKFWMSPCYGQQCVTIHTTWKQEPAVLQLLPLIEKQLEPFNPLPHWGKLFTLKPAVLQSRLPKLDAFKQLIEKYDPKRKFSNTFIKTMLY